MRGIIRGNLTFTAGEDLVQFRRVKLKSGTTAVPPEVEYADANERSIGFTETNAESGKVVSVRPHNVDGNRIAVASEAFVVGATLYGAADGKVSDTAASAAILGAALEEATADGDEVQILPFGTEIPA